MTREEAMLFCGNYIDVPPSRLYWQNSGNGVTPLEASEHAKVMRDCMNATMDKMWPPSLHAYGEHYWQPRGLGSAKECAYQFWTLLLLVAADGYDPDSRIKVAIDNRGRCVITDGMHRSSIALALGLSTVPAEVVYRSSEWWALKHALRDLNDGVKLYQPIDHPDLRWPSWRWDTQERARVIHEYLVASGMGYVWGCDYACNAGVLACALTRHGHSMRGYDVDQRAVIAARCLGGMEDIGVPPPPWSPWCGILAEAYVDMFTADPDDCDDRRNIDFVVCLSLLNHHQTDGRSAEGQKIFRDLVRIAPVIFLDCPAPGDPVGGDSPFVDPTEVFRWCAESGAPGAGSVIAERGEKLQRTILVWRRS